MSAAASKALPQADDAAPEPLVESANDTHETRMTYDDSSRMPWWVLMVWVCSMTGFIAYLVLYLFPDLAKWGSP